MQRWDGFGWDVDPIVISRREADCSEGGRKTTAEKSGRWWNQHAYKAQDEAGSKGNWKQLDLEGWRAGIV